jgi:hypothetical protein
MKRLLPGLALLVCCAAWAQTTPPSNAKVYNNIEQSSNWKLCAGPCAGGAQPISYSVMLNQSSPSRDGNSTGLYVKGNAWTDMLFIRELGAYNTAANFQSDFFFYLSSSANKIGQALEFDTFQFINNVAGAPGPVEFMWGTQCDYSQNGGVWDIWDQDLNAWVPMYNMPCVNPNRSKFRTGVWYRVIWTLHRVPPGRNLTYGGMSFDSVRIIEYAGNRESTSSDYTYQVNSVQRAGPLPAGWSDQLGVQFQIDLNGQANTSNNPDSITEWVDMVKLSAW